MGTAAPAWWGQTLLEPLLACPPWKKEQEGEDPMLSEGGGLISALWGLNPSTGC